ncbi:MAG: lipopolysaccharide kinase InaA family protein [Porticoccaceae bacterium]
MMITARDTLPRFLVKTAGPWRCFVNPLLGDIALVPDSTAATPVDVLLANRESIPASRAATVYRAQLDAGGTLLPVFVKEFRYRSAFDRIKHLFRKSRSLRAFEADQLLNREGFATPTTLLTGWRQRGFIRDRFFTITAELSGYDNLYRHLEQLTTTAPRAKRTLIESLARTIATLHNRGIVHGDLRLGNIMACCDNDWRFAFLDNERTRQFSSLPEPLRIKNLVQLNMLTGPTLTRGDRLRFFHAYCASCPGAFDVALLRQRVVARTRQRLSRLVALGRLAPGDLWL